MAKLAVAEKAEKRTRAPQRVYAGTWRWTVEGKSEEVTQLFCGSDFGKVSFKIRKFEQKGTLDGQLVSLVLREDMVI